MAAPLGFKTFTTGEVLTAADTNGYLMQGVLVFADAAARSAAITSPQEGQSSYLKDTDEIQVYSGAAWITKSGGLPSQTGNSGKYLTTDGTDASWGAIAGGSMTLLSTTSLSGSSTTVSSISGSYKDLLIRLIGARTSNVAAGAVFIRANGNTGGNYDYNSFSCIGAMNTSTGQTTYNPDVVVPTTANNNFVEISIPNYANASTLKFFNSLSTNETNNNVRVSFLKINGLTAAITSITFLEGDGKTFNGGTIEIYGVN